MDPLSIDTPIKPGGKGRMPRIVQEWLGLHRIHTAVDGAYGPATAGAVRAFQRRMELKESGIVGTTTYDRLVAPLRAALAPITPPKNATLGDSSSRTRSSISRSSRGRSGGRTAARGCACT